MGRFSVKKSFSNVVNSVSKSVNNVVNSVSNSVNNVVDSKLTQKAINGTQNLAGAIKDSAGNFISGAGDVLNNGYDASVGTLKNFRDATGRSMLRLFNKNVSGPDMPSYSGGGGGYAKMNSQGATTNLTGDSDDLDLVNLRGNNAILLGANKNLKGNANL